ncbi:LuxR C-terminal-related transcriptional regulator [Streptomyces sp. NPDC057950]|uniref:helix-turn-helix transcriptional regulator n=1 Tax=Streptomyces sp. NPDC057950 TaxID=3346288 RepID=UPI0036EDE62F
MLQPLGLDELAYVVYRFTLSQPGCRLEDLLHHLDGDENAIRVSVDRLLELALLRPVSGTLVPTRPPLALRTLLQRQQSELLRQEREFTQIKTAVDRLSEEYEYAQAPGSHAGWDRLETPAAIHARMERLAGKATVECLSLLPADIPVDTLDARRSMDHHMLERSVSVWNLHLESIYNDRSAVSYARWLVSNGGGVGTVPTLPLWLVIYDRTTALLSVDPCDPAAGAVEVTGAGFLTGLVALFERIWASMTPLDVDAAASGDEPSPVEREVLRLMGQGLTDEAVCKKLGIGLRTLRRTIAELMERLGARSRFEAGANAVDRGWLRPCPCSSDRPPRPRDKAQPAETEHGQSVKTSVFV